jgi:hypothetical protein
VNRSTMMGLGVMPLMARSVTGATAWDLGEMFPRRQGHKAGAGRGRHLPGRCFGAGHATSSTTSDGATATAVGVTPAKALTSRWRWDSSTYPLSARDGGGAVPRGETVGRVVETDQLRGALGGEADPGSEPGPQPLTTPSGLGLAARPGPARRGSPSASRRRRSRSRPHGLPAVVERGRLPRSRTGRPTTPREPVDGCADRPALWHVSGTRTVSRPWLVRLAGALPRA